MAKTENMAKTESKALAIIPDRAKPYELLLGAVSGTVDLLEAYDTEEVQRALALGILGSETEEEVFASASLTPWSEWLNRPVEVQDVHFNPSQAGMKGPGFYAVVKLVDLETGETAVKHVGGYRPSSQLLWVWSRGRLPFKCKLTEVGKAAQGQNAPLGIVNL
jgi:hypothetical protein